MGLGQKYMSNFRCMAVGLSGELNGGTTSKIISHLSIVMFSKKLLQHKYLQIQLFTYQFQDLIYLPKLTWLGHTTGNITLYTAKDFSFLFYYLHIRKQKLPILLQI